MMRISIFIAGWLSFLLFYSVHTYGQTDKAGNKNLQKSKLSESQKSKSLGLVTAGFTAPDQVCTNAPFQIVNTSTGATNYYWSFCAANSTSVASGVNLGNPGAFLNGPVFTDLAQDNSGNYFVFAVNNYTNEITRMNFGNSLLNVPVADNLGSFAGAIPRNTEGIQLVNVNGSWTAIIVGGDPVSGNPSSVAKIDFGTSLATTSPVAVNWGNIGGLSYPTDLYVFAQGGNWYGYTVNSRSNSISRLNFGVDFSTAPSGINLGNIGNLNVPVGIGAIDDGGNWYLFITNNGDGTLTRLDFGNSLLNAPGSQNIGNPGGTLNNPRDISFIKFCDGIKGYIVNWTGNTTIQMDFGNNLTGIPNPTSLGNLGNMDFPHSLSKFFRANNDIFAFVTNVNSNTITRLRFAGCNLPGSTLQNPSPITYGQPGVYDINLMIDVGLPTQTSFCKQVLVNDCSIQNCNGWLSVPSYQSFVQVGDLDVSGDQITVEAVFNRTAPYSGGPLFAGDLVSKHWDPGNVNYLLRPNEAEITTTDGIYHITPPVCDIELNKIYHVAMVYDGVSLKFYRNGFLLSQTPVSGNLFQNDFPTQIGLYNGNIYNTNLIGYINEVRIWNVARTQAQIQANMNTSLPSPATQPGLLAYYTFNSLLNQQGNPAWDGTLGGSATINQTNSICNFVADNDCCPAITGTFTGNEICVGKNGLLTFHPTSTPVNQPYTLFFSDQVNNYSQSNVQDGIPFTVPNNPTVTTSYPLLKITDAASCTTLISNESATITVDPPGHFTITPDTSICANGTVQLNVSGGQAYAWSPAANLDNPNTSNPVAQISQSTRFFVAGKDLNNCDILDSVMVNILTEPVFQAPSDQTICKGSSAILANGNDPKNVFVWTPANFLSDPGSSTPIATPDQTIVYNLAISDSVCPQYDSNFNVQVTSMISCCSKHQSQTTLIVQISVHNYP